MSEIIKVDKDKIKNVTNKINEASADIKSLSATLLDIISDIDFAWHGDDKERYVSNLNDKTKFLLNMAKLLDSYNDTLNYVIEKNTSLISNDNMISLYKDGK
jgi:uncharacterized protein YukE